MPEYVPHSTDSNDIGAPSAIPLASRVTGEAAAPVVPVAVGYAGFGGPGGVWRQGRTVVLSKGTSLPPRCFKCNAECDVRPYRRGLSWHHPAIYFTILAGLLVYVIIALIVRKKAVVQVFLCEHHRARRRRVIAAAWLAALGAIALLIHAINIAVIGLVSLALLVLVLAPACYIVMGQIMVPSKIDDYFVWLKGAGPAFLASLPDTP